jgi:predicted aldo/keto reductase-like oxidoreductase
VQYRVDPNSGNKLSILGFGCMRFPRNVTQIDVHKAEQLILNALQRGINYFDTAYIYGGSEEVLGQIIHKHNVRNQIFLATKLPLAKCWSYADFDTLFQTQLERLHTDYIDYYLLHNLSDTRLWKSLCALGIEKWIQEKKDAGQIRQLGFSFHGIQSEFGALLEEYPWDFCQIQYNYINTNYQAGTEGLKKAAAKGLPVFIMEPLLGGKLAKGLPKKAAHVLKAAPVVRSPAAWALRWLWDQQEVTLVLSGMNEDAQIEENSETAQNALPNMLSQEEHAVIKAVTDLFNASYKIPCTGCNYCMPCPQKINIPACFAAYNISYITGMISGIQQYIIGTGATDPRKNYMASTCKKCGACEKHCPQHIPIIGSLEKVAKRMEPFWFRPVIRLLVKVRG